MYQLTAEIRVVVQFVCQFHRCAMNVCYSLRSPRTEVLGWGPRFASESLDADTARGSVFQTDPLPKLD
jgi:hypothetical protein